MKKRKFEMQHDPDRIVTMYGSVCESGVEKMKNIKDEITKVIVKKAQDFVLMINENIDVDKEDITLCIAGGCFFGDKINDIDLFPIEGTHFLKRDYFKNHELIFKTPNSETLKVKDQIIQLCEYKHETLEDLIKSFDFAHIQCGAEVVISNYDGFKITKTYITDDCILAWALQKTWFIGSEYPFSSLIRASKYYQRGLLTKHEFLQTNLKILIEIIKRGFRDQNDLKDQLDSIDLGYVITDSQEFNTNVLLTLRGLKDDHQNND